MIKRTNFLKECESVCGRRKYANWQWTVFLMIFKRAVRIDSQQSRRAVIVASSAMLALHFITRSHKFVSNPVNNDKMVNSPSLLVEARRPDILNPVKTMADHQVHCQLAYLRRQHSEYTMNLLLLSDKVEQSS
ncbi:hypothetical protein T06_7571 [Trichinella sp. T6]|nr:hypothetical protein T06_7571 [Trichinella sp. T6]